MNEWNVEMHFCFRINILLCQLVGYILRKHSECSSNTFYINSTYYNQIQDKIFKSVPWQQSEITHELLTWYHADFLNRKMYCRFSCCKIVFVKTSKLRRVFNFHSTIKIVPMDLICLPVSITTQSSSRLLKHFIVMLSCGEIDPHNFF